MKNLSYTTFFGNKKVTHEEALKERIIGFIIDIIADENKVSEKSFKQYDEIIKEVNNNFNEEMFNISEKFYNEGKRLRYISEYLYDKYFKINTLQESKIITFRNFVNNYIMY